MTDPSSDAASTSDAGTVAFIGGGNMARSLVGGAVSAGHDPATLRIADPDAATRDALAADFGVATFATAAEAVDGAGTWVFAVKPQVMRAVAAPLAGAAATARPLVVSVAAGITSAQLDAWLGGGHAVVRAMPNTPALLRAGATGLFANDRVDEAGRARAESLLSSAGYTAWIADEALMDAVTAVSGSGPAYVFLLAEAMAAAAEAQGLPAGTAADLVGRTLLGASRMLVESGDAPATLRRRVTSPGGTTEAAIARFEDGGLRALVADAIDAATRRGRDLSAANDG